jgi:hypothetical protein
MRSSGPSGRQTQPWARLIGLGPCTYWIRYSVRLVLHQDGREYAASLLMPRHGSTSSDGCKHGGRSLRDRALSMRPGPAPNGAFTSILPLKDQENPERGTHRWQLLKGTCRPTLTKRELEGAPEMPLLAAIARRDVPSPTPLPST